jgi:hypothetical protein
MRQFAEAKSGAEEHQHDRLEVIDEVLRIRRQCGPAARRAPVVHPLPFGAHPSVALAQRMAQARLFVLVKAVVRP